MVSERTTDKVGRSGILLPIEGDCWQVVMSAREGAARVLCRIACTHRMQARKGQAASPAKSRMCCLLAYHLCYW